MCLATYLEKLKVPLTFCSAKWSRYSQWSNMAIFHLTPYILPHFPWYGRPLYPLAVVLWPPDLTHKILFHPPPSFLPALYPPFFSLPESVWGQQLMDGPLGGVARRVRSAFWNFSELQQRWRETNWIKIGRDLGHERNEGEKTCCGQRHWRKY